MTVKEAIEIAAKEVYREEFCDTASLVKYRAVELLGGIDAQKLELVNFHMDNLSDSTVAGWREAASHTR